MHCVWTIESSQKFDFHTFEPRFVFQLLNVILKFEINFDFIARLVNKGVSPYSHSIVSVYD